MSKQKTAGLLAGAALLCVVAVIAGLPRRAPADNRGLGGSVWGANYFPNIPLVTHEGKQVRFFDDLIKDKVVAVNFIYTSCPDSCPMETARLLAVQRILGDRVGKDVFFYSITIDPEYDTQEVLADYVKKFRIGPGWWFLTGKKEDIVRLRKKLGVYIQDIQAEGSKDHNLSMVIGNQKTGRWMKRSPFENPYVLANQLGSWLSNWKAPNPGKRDYAQAPALRQISAAEDLFRTRCASCHTIGRGDIANSERRLVGPDLLNVTSQRDRKWLRRWLLEPDIVLSEKDPLAMSLLARYEGVPMPNFRLTAEEVEDLLTFLEEASRNVEMRRMAGGQPDHSRMDHSDHQPDAAAGHEHERHR